jgi:phosphoglycerol transferase MdoB-like AlkP superfamily enzyme
MRPLLALLRRAWLAFPFEWEWRGLVHFNFATWFMLGAQAFTMANMVSFGVLHLDPSPSGRLALVLTPLCVWSFSQMLNALLAPWRWTHFLVNGVVLILASLLPQFHAEAGASLDFALMKDNFGELFYREAASMALSPPTQVTLAGVLVGSVAGAWAEWRFRFISGARPLLHRYRLLAVGSAVYIAIFLLPFTAYHELTFTLQTAVRYQSYSPQDAPAPFFEERGVDFTAPFPYASVRAAPAAATVPPTRPDIILIMVESFNGLFVGRRTPDGREVTPEFNRLARQGVHVERFYGNSMQTAKGHFATLCGVLPTFRGKEFSTHRNVHLPCLPSLLKDAGYRTAYLTAFRDMEFDNTGDFLLHHGMDVVQSLNPSPVPPEEADHVWGWGLQDDRFFRRAQAFLDQQEARPVFAALATISNHLHFDQLPELLRGLHQQPGSFVETYENSLQFSDRSVGAFVESLRRHPRFRDAIIIITGDHSFPVDEHGRHYNQLGSYEEIFRTPFLMIWDGHLSPQRVETPFSQNDIAPTLLGMLGIQQPGCMLGTSVLGGAPHSVFLAQPYDGTHLGVIEFPFKYVRELRTGAERLHDLRRDPHEDHNVAADVENTATLARLRHNVGALMFNQKLMQEDRIWPH